MKNFLYSLGIVLFFLLVEVVMATIAVFAAVGICNLFNLNGIAFKFIGISCGLIETIVIAWLLGRKGK